MTRRHLYGLIVAYLLGLSAGCGKSPIAPKPADTTPLPRPEKVKQLNSRLPLPQEAPAGN